MNSPPMPTDSGRRREAIVVAALTLGGGALRLWSPGRLGLVHFDEGIYAMAGEWVLSPRGLAGLDPSVISYAPPGFPFVVGLVYALLGVSDRSAILASVVAGTLTIPAAGWLGRRTFGPGAGAASSAFCALSGQHIAFSRMALTDAPALLAWLIALGLGQRFLERPGPARAVVLGLAVGAAQLFKYNGWIAGVLVAAAASAWTLARADERTSARQAAVWGWGLLAALVASVVYWPWFRFVEAHGGYAALLAHHRGYMGGLASWPVYALAQLEQDRALSGGIGWLVGGGLAAALAMQAALGAFSSGWRAIPRHLVVALSLTALCSFFHGALFGAMLWMVVLAATRARALTPGVVVLAAGWGILAVMTPFYHPYARLLLPLQAIAWLMMGGAFAILREVTDRLDDPDPGRVWGLPAALVHFAGACWLAPILLALMPPASNGAPTAGSWLGPSDSLRRGCRSIAAELPEGLASLRVFARPPVTFYLRDRISVAPQPSLEALFAAAEPGAWALLDAAMIRPGGGPRSRLPASADRWELLRQIPTTLNLPALLDIDPSAAIRPSPDPKAPLLLFRPKRPGAAR